MSGTEETSTLGAGEVVDASTPLPVPSMLPVGMELEDVEREVNILLAGVESVEDFQQIFAAITLPNPKLEANEVETPKRYYKALLKHLVSDDIEKREDQGLEVFLKIYDYLVKDPEDPLPADVKPKTQSMGLNQQNSGLPTKIGVLSSKDTQSNNSFSSNGGSRRRPLFDMQKLKEFKLDGTIGSTSPGGKDKRLTYSSLEYQVMNALTQGYQEEVVCLAVVKAISPENELRAYFEGRKSLNVDFMLESLRGHFQESESATVLSDLGKARQKSSQTAHGFLVSVFVLRDRVFKLAREEGSPQDENFVYNRMKHAIETGVRNQNIRGELREILAKKRRVSDEELLKIAKEAMAREKARLAKFGPEDSGLDEGEEAEVSAIHARPPTPPSKPKTPNRAKPKKDPNFQVQVNELKASQEALQASVLELTTAFKDMRRENMSGTHLSSRAIPPTAVHAPPFYPTPPDPPPISLAPRIPNPPATRNQNPNRNRPTNRSNKGRCQGCVNSGARCPHCFRCGGVDHQMHECPQKN